jgi:hypothetical protein
MTISDAGAIPGIEITIDASKSSQFVSALLLIGPSMDNGITLLSLPLSIKTYVELLSVARTYVQCRRCIPSGQHGPVGNERERRG